MFTYELAAGVAIRLLRDVETDVKAAVTDGAKPLGEQLAAAIKAQPGPGPYPRVYAQFARNVRVRTRKGRAPQALRLRP